MTEQQIYIADGFYSEYIQNNNLDTEPFTTHQSFFSSDWFYFDNMNNNIFYTVYEYSTPEEERYFHLINSVFITINSQFWYNTFISQNKAYILINLENFRYFQTEDITKEKEVVYEHTKRIHDSGIFFGGKKFQFFIFQTIENNSIFLLSLFEKVLLLEKIPKILRMKDLSFIFKNNYLIIEELLNYKYNPNKNIENDVIENMSKEFMTFISPIFEIENFESKYQKLKLKKLKYENKDYYDILKNFEKKEEEKETNEKDQLFPEMNIVCIDDCNYVKRIIPFLNEKDIQKFKYMAAMYDFAGRKQLGPKIHHMYIEENKGVIIMEKYDKIIPMEEMDENIVNDLYNKLSENNIVLLPLKNKKKTFLYRIPNEYVISDFDDAFLVDDATSSNYEFQIPNILNIYYNDEEEKQQTRYQYLKNIPKKKLCFDSNSFFLEQKDNEISHGAFGKIHKVCRHQNKNDCQYVAKIVQIDEKKSLRFQIDAALSYQAGISHFGPIVYSSYLCDDAKIGVIIMDLYDDDLDFFTQKATILEDNIDILSGVETKENIESYQKLENMIHLGAKNYKHFVKLGNIYLEKKKFIYDHPDFIFDPVIRMHEKGKIFHSDLSIANMLIRSDSDKIEIKVTDFDLAFPLDHVPHILRYYDYITMIFGRNYIPEALKDRFLYATEYDENEIIKYFDQKFKDFFPIEYIHPTLMYLKEENIMDYESEEFKIAFFMRYYLKNFHKNQEMKKKVMDYFLIPIAKNISDIRVVKLLNTIMQERLGRKFNQDSTFEQFWNSIKSEELAKGI